MLNAVMLSVVMLGVVAPLSQHSMYNIWGENTNSVKNYKYLLKLIILVDNFVKTAQKNILQSLKRICLTGICFMFC
jgi:hypothetical protein